MTFICLEKNSGSTTWRLEDGKKINTEGDVPPSMSGSCAVCVDRVLYLFGGHHSRGNTNKFYMLDSRSTDRVLHWERIDCQGVPPSSKDKLGVWVYKNKLIFLEGMDIYLKTKYWELLNLMKHLSGIQVIQEDGMIMYIF